MNGFTTWEALPLDGALVSVPVLVTDVQPVADAVNVVVPVPEPLAATVTGCGRFQLLELSVIVLPLVMERPPPDAATVTAIGLAGDAVRLTPMSVVVPAGTLNVGGLIFRLTPEPQEPVAVDVGEALGLVDAVGDDDGEDDGDDDGEVDAVGEDDGLLPTDVVAVQVTPVGAALLPL